MSDIYDEKKMIDDLQEQEVDDERPSRKRKAHRPAIVENDLSDDEENDESEGDESEDEALAKKPKKNKLKIPIKRRKKVKLESPENPLKKVKLSLYTLSETRKKELRQKIYDGCLPSPSKPECLVNNLCEELCIRDLGGTYMKTRVILMDIYKREIIDNSVIFRVCETKNCVTTSHLFPLLRNNYPNKQERYRNYFDYIKAHCKVDAATDCWIFTGDVTGDYGKGGAKFTEITTREVHRIMYMLRNLDFNIPSAIAIRHDQGPLPCSSKACCNPAHLEKGTALNNKDDDRKNGKILEGEKNPNSKITKAVAQKIIDSKGQGTKSERAKRFDVNIHTIKHLNWNRTWTSLPRKGIIKRNPKQAKNRKRVRDHHAHKRQNGFTVDEYKSSTARLEDLAELKKCVDLIGHNRRSKIKDCQLLSKKKWASIGGCTRSYPHQIMFEHYNNNNRLVKYHPKNRMIRHLCKPLKDKLCIEPSHLKLGTAKENRQDQIYWADKEDVNQD